MFKIFSRLNRSDSSKRFEVQTDKHSLTEQEHVVDIPSLLKMYDGHLKDLFAKFNNKLVYESTLGGVFIDQLNEKEVAAYNEYMQRVADKQAEVAKENALFEQFKESLAAKVVNTPAITPSPAPAPAPAPSE